MIEFKATGAPSCLYRRIVKKSPVLEPYPARAWFIQSAWVEPRHLVLVKAPSVVLMCT